jgi:hypothetical protein
VEVVEKKGCPFWEMQKSEENREHLVVGSFGQGKRKKGNAETPSALRRAKED